MTDTKAYRKTMAVLSNIHRVANSAPALLGANVLVGVKSFLWVLWGVTRLQYQTFLFGGRCRSVGWDFLIQSNYVTNELTRSDTSTHLVLLSGCRAASDLSLLAERAVQKPDLNLWSVKPWDELTCVSRWFLNANASMEGKLCLAFNLIDFDLTHVLHNSSNRQVNV